MKKACERAKVKPFGFHAIRKRCLRSMAKDGADTGVKTEFMGCKDI